MENPPDCNWLRVSCSFLQRTAKLHEQNGANVSSNLRELEIRSFILAKLQLKIIYFENYRENKKDTNPIVNKKMET